MEQTKYVPAISRESIIETSTKSFIQVARDNPIMAQKILTNYLPKDYKLEENTDVK